MEYQKLKITQHSLMAYLKDLENIKKFIDNKSKSTLPTTVFEDFLLYVKSALNITEDINLVLVV